MGLAAVTEPNTGDIAVKLKGKRSRGIDEIISEVRAKVNRGACAGRRIHAGVAGHDFGDLTGGPQPVVVQLFSPDRQTARQLGPQVADAWEEFK